VKILQIHNFYLANGGEDAVFLAEGKLLESYGNEVVQYTVNNSEISGVVGKLITGINLVYSRLSKESVEEFITLKKPDIVHIHNFFPLLTPSIYDACIAVGVPVVQTLHNYRTICPGAFLMRNGRICEDCIGGSAYQSILHGCYRGSYIGTLAVARMVEGHRKRQTWNNKVARFIALTEFAKQKFIQAGLPEGKIAVKANFIGSDVSKRKSPKSNKPYALFVGRLSKEKGIETLLMAWERISLHLLLAGDGPLLNAVKSVEQQNVHSLGHMLSDELQETMAQASFLVMPSEWYEGFPMVLVEAFENGIPVIASRLGGMAEIIEDGVTGLHFEAGNSVDLAEKVTWMHNNPEKCKEMGENARKVYQEKYTPEINYKILMQIYQEAIDEYQ